MKKNIDSWCVEVTRENIESVKKWGGKDLASFFFTIGSFYGITKDGRKNGFSGVYKNKYFSKVISTEEFLQKINVQQEFGNKETGFNIWN